MPHSNLIEVLEDKSKLTGRGITFIEGGSPEEFLSYADLYDSALRALAWLYKKGIRPKDELVFQVDDNKSFIILFWACLLGAIIPVPLTIGKNEDHKRKLFAVWTILNDPWLVISRQELDKLNEFAIARGLITIIGNIRSKIIDQAEALAGGEKGQSASVTGDDIAFIQFSSGSTGQPKGVILTHKNLITNIQAISEAAGYAPGDTLLSWMPLTHDMGLIGFHINPLFCGLDHYLMPPALFIRRPSLWLDKATAYKISILCSPNFGYEYLVKHCLLNSEKHDWDLSAVRLIYNGAEPVSEKLCRNFTGRLAAYGLKSHAMCPVYGLAEASLAVSISALDDEVIALSIDRDKAGPGDRIAPAPPDGIPLSFVNVGKPVNGCSIRIADGEDRPVGENIIGHLLINGDNVTSGYYKDEEESKKARAADGWLRTGDLGFLREGALYITGRTKDIIFINGQNYYPHDIERIAEEVDGIELNKVAVAGYFNNELQKEEVVAFVLHRGDPEAFINVAGSLQALVNDKTGIKIDRVIPVKDISRTTSGKLQRFRLLQQYKTGAFMAVERTLQERIGAARTGAGGPALPENDTEQKLLKIWENVLDIKGIGPTQKFFLIGGNSLKAAEMIMQIQKEYQMELPMDIVFEKPTIRELALEIGHRKEDNRLADKQKPAGIPVAPEKEDYPLSSAQKRIYYSWELDRSSIAYNIPVTWKINRVISIHRLEMAVTQLINRHDSWRMIIYYRGEPRLKILDTVPFALNCYDCPPPDVDKKLKALVRPFDLNNGPLFHIELLRTGVTEYLFFAHFHHIISDGISIYHFMKELQMLYKGDELQQLPVQYKDFIGWEKDRLDSGLIRQQGAYWQERLQGGLPVLDMPLDFQRPAIFNQQGGRIGFTLDATISEGLKRLAGEHNCSLHAVMFTAYAILISKYTGQEDMVIGIPVGSRRHPDLQYVQGMFVNNLALRCRIKEDWTFVQILLDQWVAIKGALNNQDYPFDALLEALNVRRDISRNPVFDTMFVYQNMGSPIIKSEGLTLSGYSFDPGFSKFDISMEVFDDEGPLRFAIEYSEGLFKRSTIARLAQHFNILVRRIVDNPHSPVARLPLISDVEYDECIRQFNATRTKGQVYPTMHEWFRRQAEKTPDNIAVIHGPEAITYKQLNDKTDKLAALLRRKGAAPDQATGILMQRSPGLIISILGVLKSGGCFLPIEPGLPVERIKFLLRESGCRLLITGQDGAGSSLLKDMPAIEMMPETAIVEIDNAFGPADTLTGEIPGTSREGNTDNPHNLAYVIYTSGTTGTPKGVMIEHRSLVNYIAWAAESYGQDGKLSFPLFTSISFDLTITSIFVPLVTGNSIVIYGEETGDPALEKIFADNNTDIIKLTPSHLRLLNEIPVHTPVAHNRIKRMIVGGEKLESRLAKDIFNKFEGRVAIFNEYGPTEATVGCMIHLFNEEELTPGVPIGIPAANTRIYILDKFLLPVPPGIKGELYIAGDGLARGYLLNRELTDQKFIPDPFQEGARMYKTGDLARHLPGGTIEYIGRVDQQVKLNGYRIELQEIESHLVGRFGITEALVTVRKNRKGKESLFAYYTRQAETPDSAPGEEYSWKDYLAARLPHYMIPSRFIRLERIPLTSNGKIDFTALPDPVTNGEVAGSRDPGDEIERILLQVWGEVLHENNLCVTDNFFDLGGDSIKAVQIVSRLLDKGIALRAKDMLTYHTIAQVSRHAAIADINKGYEQGMAEGQMPLTPVGTWFFALDLKNPGYYNQSVLLTFHRKVDAALLENAFEKLIEHHDGLRMNFDLEKNILFYNNNHREADFTLTEGATGPSVFMEWKSRFDITKSLLIRAVLLGDSPGDAGRLFITAHHLVMDGMSWRILLEDLYAAYTALEKGAAIRLPRKTASLPDWEKALQEFSLSEGLQREEAYWNSIDSIAFTIPQDLETNDWSVQHMRKVTGSLEEDRTAFLLGGANKAYHTDTPVILNTALIHSLKEWTGLEQFVIEQENHGRHLDPIDASRTIGWFTVLYPVLLEWKGESPASRIKAVKEGLRSVPHQGMGYGICKSRNGSDNGQRGKLTEIRFNYLGQFDKELDNELFSYSHVETGSDSDPFNTMTAKLECNMMVIFDRLHIEIIYNSNAHHESTITWFRDIFFRHLGIILDHLETETELHFTPSDFEAAGLSEKELKELFH